MEPRTKPTKTNSDVEMGRHARLLMNPQVRSWYDARCLRSRLSADSCVRKLGYLLERMSLDPTGVLALARKHPDQLRDLLIRYATQQKRAGRLDTYIAKSFDGLQSFLRFARVPFDGFPRLDAVRGASLVNERVPTPEELGWVLERLSLRGRVIALLMAHSGLRPGVLGSYGGERGLTLADLPDLQMGKALGFNEIPFVVKVPAQLSKTRASYVTFGTGQLANALTASLSERRENGEKLSPSTPVVAANETRGVARTSREEAKFSHGFLATKTVVEELRSALRVTAPEGVRWRPYVLRSYCATRLLLAEGDGGRISRDLREAILGHDTGVAGRYTVGKRWGSELLAEARREYARASEFLETTARRGSDFRADFNRGLAEAVGVPKDEAAKYETATPEELLRVLRDRLLGATAKSETTRAIVSDAPNPTSRARQVPVPLAQADRMLEEGWTVVREWHGDRMLMQRPEAAD